MGLGPAGADLVTTGVLQAIERVPVRFLRTARHPSAAVVPGAVAFDHLYDEASDLEGVYTGIVSRLVTAAAEAQEVLYAVPGSPVVAERTVELLLADPRVEVEVVPALSFLDLAWARLGVDPVAAGVRVVDGHRFAVEAAGERGPLLVAQCDSRWVLSEVKLAVEDAEPATVTVLQRLGLTDEHVRTIAWNDLDREIVPDHLTSLWVPELNAPVAHELAGFAAVVRTLRERCPWDREQTHASLTRYVLEEAYEVVEAIDGGDPALLAEELGDLLLQVFLHATIAAQAGDFTVADVARGISDKMVRRHPHVFGDVAVDSVEDVRRNWETIKRAEKGPPAGGALAGVDGSLPALLYAAKLGKRAAGVGFDWQSPDPVFAKVEEELAELRAAASADELGDLLFAVVNLARHLGHDPEAALRAAAAKFRRRFEVVERLAAERGLELAGAGEARLDELWEEAKRGAGPGPAPA
ncbi:MAG: nucleoside triphosphate pyrophosphohydrolase [Actinobacteria bacterium]|nr:nucleoside triphosphate pyrophosphohydrolase [Actinomycetota bacterium]